jgi:hypothetical protein
MKKLAGRDFEDILQVRGGAALALSSLMHF